MPSHKVAARRSDGQATYQKILDTSERLFSEHGLSGVSLREITRQAEIDLASIKYYFGSKEGLFDAVLAHRVDGMSEERLRGLAKIDIVPGSAETLRALFSTYVKPFHGNTEAETKELRNYRLMVALVANSRTWQDRAFKDHYDPTARQFLDALLATLPDADPKDIHWGFSFFVAGMVNVSAETGRIDRLSDGLCKSSDLHDGFERLVEQTVASFLAF